MFDRAWAQSVRSKPHGDGDGICPAQPGFDFARAYRSAGYYRDRHAQREGLFIFR